MMMITRYQTRISGPLMDRIDLHVDVPRVEYEKLTAKMKGQPSAVVRERVEAAPARQAQRFAAQDLTLGSNGILSRLHFAAPGSMALIQMRGGREWSRIT